MLHIRHLTRESPLGAKLGQSPLDMVEKDGMPGRKMEKMKCAIRGQSAISQASVRKGRSFLSAALGSPTAKLNDPVS